MRYTKGDIVICTTDKMYGMRYLLKVGQQYVIEDSVIVNEKTLVSVSDIDTNIHIGIFDDKHFIPIDIWREFRLKKILD